VALVAAGVLLAAAAPAPAAAPVLLAQIDETASGAQFPPLLDDAPIEEPEGPGDEEPTGPTGPEKTDGDADGDGPAEPGLPNTGAEAWLVALLGTGMVLSGGGLRLTLADGRGRRR